MATATAPANTAATRKARGATTRVDRQAELHVGWAVRNRAGQVVVIYEGVTAQAAAQEWADDRSYTIEAVTL